MKLESIHFRHTYHFSDLKINFQPVEKPIALLIGDQASGKTAILKNIYQALTWFPARYKDLRTPGVVMLDQDITYHRVQSKIDVQVSIPAEIGTLKETSDAQTFDLSHCSWQLYKTLSSNGVGLSKVEVQQLEQLAGLYTQAIKDDPLQGLPLVAYYPTERFVHEINLLSKNNPAVFHTAAAYELAAIPYTTFARFFEWFREVSDIENAQTALLFQKIVDQKESLSAEQISQPTPSDFPLELLQARNELHAPSLQSLRNSLNKVFPEITDLFLEYQPKLQLMVTIDQETICYQQLSNTIKNWIALVGDIVRRMCLLNPASLYPCLEGEGILLIDNIDDQLDEAHSLTILDRLHAAFPQLQIIASSHRNEILETAEAFQCFKIAHQTIQEINLTSQHTEFENFYTDLVQNKQHSDVLEEPRVEESATVQMLYQHFKKLTPEQQQILQRLIQEGDDTSSHESLL